jgi:hypothetical protein
MLGWRTIGQDDGFALRIMPRDDAPAVSCHPYLHRFGYRGPMQEWRRYIHPEPGSLEGKILSITSDKGGMSLRCLLGLHSFKLLERGGGKRAIVECCRCRHRLRLSSCAQASGERAEGYRKL